jgi:hypothetical protein
MRLLLLVPFAALAAVVIGCRTQETEQAALSKPPRDLALPAQGPEVAIASPVELGQVVRPHRTARPVHRTPLPAPAPAPRQRLAASNSAPAVVPVVQATYVVEPLSTPGDPLNDRELPPGKTVTLVPASSGPSTAIDPSDEIPAVRIGSYGGRAGGRCGPRGRRPGIGIAAAPRPDFR